MEKNIHKGCLPKGVLSIKEAFIAVFAAMCVLSAAILAAFSCFGEHNDVDTFSEKTVTLSDGWSFSDGAGNDMSITLPYTVCYGADGRYVMSRVLTSIDGLLESPVVCVYSNYMNLTVWLEDEIIYEYPAETDEKSNPTGNTYHFIRLEPDYSGKTLRIQFYCQLSDGIDYLIKAPVIGSKATMTGNAVTGSLPAILLAGCMLILAAVLAVFYFMLRKKLKLNSSTAFTALFAAVFSLYVFCETLFAQLVISNSYALLCATLMLLALIPIPLIGIFAEEVSVSFQRIPVWLMMLCSTNFIIQMILNFSGLSSFRVMLPATHCVIILSTVVMVICLLASDRGEKPQTPVKLISALPMIVGGTIDIMLLALKKPSFNNSLWFTIGVTVFIIIQFFGFVRGFFVMYRTSLEAGVLRNLAYRDVLTDTGNRNAYERRINELSENGMPGGLCCIVADINDLKYINDRYGHSVGDAAILNTGRLLRKIMPEGSSVYRTGGDEFVTFIYNCDEKSVRALADRLCNEVKSCGDELSIPLSVSAGSGCCDARDGGVLELIKRVDADMYEKKRAEKCSPSYHISADLIRKPDD